MPKEPLRQVQVMFGQRVVIESRADDYKAYLEAEPCVWGCGMTCALALADCLITWNSLLHVEGTPQPVGR